MLKLFSRNFFFIFTALTFSMPTLATCYRVTSVGSATTTSNTQIRPGEGSAASFSACDTCNGSLSLPTVINVTDPSFQPYPTLIASSVVPFILYGDRGGYDPERVFYRCAPEDAVYEQFSTNADNLYSGWYNGGDSVGISIGLESAYRTAWPNVLLRLTHVETGQFFTDIWHERLLTGLDIDSRGFQLVKAKNLSAIKAELFSAPLESTRYYSPSTPSQLYSYTQPAGYIAIKGPGISSPTTGNSHAVDYTGWASYWPGTIGLYNNVTLKRYPTCAVTNVTPHIFFPSISVGEINNGDSREATFEVAFKCQTGATSSVASNGTALGVKASAGSQSAAASLGLINANGGLSYLVSDRYGTSGFANGVGIVILRNGQQINLLANENSGLGSASANEMGWYPVIGPSSDLISSSDGIAQYRELFSARLEKLRTGTQPPVTAGKVEATAEVVIRVQ
ncbi:fimbrial protein [Comamonas sp. NoAH]|uniref:fimbrial protein n=1 Tax=Comamonas halotolerans TaxID=3041496 RepID=UPI0024E06F67|nr:fimbrial protein [Comamonas sp. NoAH]